MYVINKDIAKLLRPLVDAGWRVEKAKRSSHVKLYDTTGAQRASFGMFTGGVSRCLANARSVVRRLESELDNSQDGC